MKIFTNEALIKRNRRIAIFFMIGGMAVLAGGMWVTSQSPELAWVTLLTLLFGLLFSQVGFYFMNRYGRSPATHQLFNSALKGLDSNYALFHFTTPTSHLLVGPAGLWVLSPRYQRGKILFAKGRWHHRGAGLFQAYLNLFAQQGLGRPDLELPYEIEKVQAHLKKLMPEETIPPVKAALVFVDRDIKIEIAPDEKPPAETLALPKLKEYIRKQAKKKLIALDKLEPIQRALAGSVQSLEETADDEQDAD